MRELYGLTEAEAEVLRLLVEGHGSTEMAEVRGVSVHTVVSQIKSVLSKTGTRGCPALVPPRPVRQPPYRSGPCGRRSALRTV
jgi:DNA-binding CsgD family transcriptional regulator